MSKIIHQLNRLSIFASHHYDPRASWLLSTFRLLTLGLLLTFSLLTFNSCGLDVEDPIPPSPPVWVQKSLPEEWPERGIDAHESRAIFLEWKPDAVGNIEAYKIYRATYYGEKDSVGDFELITIIDAGLDPSLVYYDSQVLIRTKYYYKLKAQDNVGRLSSYSDSIHFKTLPQISNDMMSPNGYNMTLGDTRELSWQYNHTFEMEDYVLTILTHDNDLVSRVTFSPNNYTGGSESWTIPETVLLKPDQVYKWRIDIGAMYVNDIESSASESNWAIFQFSND